MPLKRHVFGLKRSLRPHNLERQGLQKLEIVFAAINEDIVLEQLVPALSELVQLTYLAPMDRLFNDTAYAHNETNLYRLNMAYFKLASSAQGTEVGKNFNMYEIYTPEELYDNWLQANTYWYVLYGAYPQNGGTQPFVQRNLLREMIKEADSCIAQKGHGATLRYGHETIVLPLACLLGLNGFDQQISDLEQLTENNWVNYKVFPMAANIQFVFYRKNPQDQDVLFKVLLNENEATLPLQTDCAPYYHWNDFRDYYLKKLDSYKE